MDYACAFKYYLLLILPPGCPGSEKFMLERIKIKFMHEYVHILLALNNEEIFITFTPLMKIKLQFLFQFTSPLSCMSKLKNMKEKIYDSVRYKSKGLSINKFPVTSLWSEFTIICVSMRQSVWRGLWFLRWRI